MDGLKPAQYGQSQPECVKWKTCFLKSNHKLLITSVPDNGSTWTTTIVVPFEFGGLFEIMTFEFDGLFEIRQSTEPVPESPSSSASTAVLWSFFVEFPILLLLGLKGRFEKVETSTLF